MNRTYVPGSGLADWRSRLADPEKHWKRGASAFEAAVSWEVAAATPRGLPRAIATVLDQEELLRGAALLFAFPEHKVPLPGGSRPSQTDVWCMLRGSSGLISMAVEAKAEESFGETIATWLTEDSKGKQQRLAYLSDVLRLPVGFPNSLRYQLLHRTASAISEARHIGANAAVMMVHSFRGASPSEADYLAFGDALGARLAPERLVRVEGHADPQLFLGWATSGPCTDAEVARASL